MLEFIFTFLFIAVLYGTAVGTSGNNGFTVLSPLAAGLALYVSIEAVGPYTGAPLNPARLIGPAVVFFCNWRHFWVWLAGAFKAPTKLESGGFLCWMLSRLARDRGLPGRCWVYPAMRN